MGSFRSFGPARGENGRRIGLMSDVRGRPLPVPWQECGATNAIDAMGAEGVLIE